MSVDHVHVLVSCPPLLSPANLVQYFIGGSSRKLQEEFTHLRKRYWGQPLYPFGFGLSYTRFTYSDLTLDATTIQAGESLSLYCTLTNSGSVEAAEVAQIYLSDLEASTVVPVHSLIGFRRVHLKPGERVLEPGEFRVTVGGGSPSERCIKLGASAPVTRTFTVTA